MAVVGAEAGMAVVGAEAGMAVVGVEAGMAVVGVAGTAEIFVSDGDWIQLFGPVTEGFIFLRRASAVGQNRQASFLTRNHETPMDHQRRGQCAHLLRFSQWIS
jgi:hypothetical protein